MTIAVMPCLCDCIHAHYRKVKLYAAAHWTVSEIVTFPAEQQGYVALQKKWEATEETKGTYRPIPPEPAGLPESAADLPKGTDAINEFNARMSAHWSQVHKRL